METKTIFSNLYTSKYFEKLPDFKEKKTQVFITITLTLITISFFSIFAINPTLSTIFNLQKQKEDNTFVEEKLSQKSKNLNILTQKYKEIEPDLPYIYQAIPKTPEAPLLLGQLATLASENTVQLTRLQVSDVELTKHAEGRQKFSTVGFSLEAQGDYQNLLHYLNAVTNFERIITLDSVTLTKGTTKTVDIKLNIQGTAFFKQ